MKKLYTQCIACNEPLMHRQYKRYGIDVLWCDIIHVECKIAYLHLKNGRLHKFHGYCLKHGITNKHLYMELVYNTV